MKTMIAAVLALASLVPCAALAGEGFGEMTPPEVMAKLKQKNVYVFDNNPKEKYQAGHVPGAILVRDTTQHGRGPVLRVTPADWQRFAATVRAGQAIG